MYVRRVARGFRVVSTREVYDVRGFRPHGGNNEIPSHGENPSATTVKRSMPSTDGNKTSVNLRIYVSRLRRRLANSRDGGVVVRGHAADITCRRTSEVRTRKRVSFAVYVAQHTFTSAEK